MKNSIALVSGLLVAGLFSTTTLAQSWDADQTSVWQAVEKTWDVNDVDGTWLNTTTHPDVSGWSRSAPAPRSRPSLINWNKFHRESGKALIVELSPLKIVTVNSTAVAHYYYSMISESTEGKRETEHGSCTDTLTKQDENWLYLGWSCGELAKD